MKGGNFSSLLGPPIPGPTSTAIRSRSRRARSTIRNRRCTHIALRNVTAAGFQIPVSRTQFPGNIIPVNRMDPAWAKIIQLYPNPNQAVITGNAPTNDYYYNTTRRSDYRSGRRARRLSPQR